MALAELIAGMGVAGSLFGASKAAKAARAQADAIRYAADRESETMREISAPFLNEAKFALPMLRETIMSQIAPTVGKDNPFLAGAHERNIAGIDRGAGRAKAASTLALGKTGNTGKLRGEMLTIGQSADEAKGRAELDYGVAQTGYRDSRTQMMTDNLFKLGGAGSAGIGPAMSGASATSRGAQTAAMVEGSAKQDFWGDIGELAGVGIGSYMSDLDAKRMAKLRKAMAGDAPRP